MYDVDAAPIVRRVREASALSQRELADRAGTTQAVVSRVESGVASPSFDMVRRLANAAGFELRLECVPHRVTDLVVDAYKPGVDQSLLIANLRKSPRERFSTLLSARRFILKVRRVGEEARNRVAEPTATYGGQGDE